MRRFIFMCIFFILCGLLYGQNGDIYDGDGYFIAQNGDCTADFSYSIVNKIKNSVMIKFKSNMKGSARYSWDFGDGSNSNQQHPVHTYNISTTKVFTVTLEVTARDCSDKKTQTLSFSEKDCSAAFTYKILKSDKDSADVQFTVSEPVPSTEYRWSFGDGKGTKKMNPIHRYRFSGEKKFTVRLKVTKGSCEDEKVQVITLGTAEPGVTCSANFDYEILSQDEKGAVIQFVSRMEKADKYSWNFDDGSTSSDKNPVHVYEFKGKYIFNVTLEVQKQECRDKQTGTIKFPGVPEEVDTGCSADFTYEIVNIATSRATVRFASKMKDASSYEWSFGDKKTSTDRDPVHVYAITVKKVFEVTLHVEKTGCKDKRTKTITIEKAEEVDEDECSADFSFEIKRHKGAGGAVQFTSAMVGASAYRWDFGDGQTSIEENPAYVYDLSKTRTFTVSLEVRKGTCTDKKSKIVTFPGEPESECTAKFSYTIIRQDNTKGLVQFTPDLDDSFARFSWDFGDGTKSTKKNPVHTFRITAKQQFQVVLKVIKGGCSDTHTEMINFTEGLCTAGFTVKITYNDGKYARVEITCNEGTPDADFTCNFGDGTISKEWNPVHTYNISRKKKFIITLRVRKGDCDDQTEQEVSF